MTSFAHYFFTRSVLPVFTGRNEVVAKVMFLLVSVILLTWGCLPQCMLGYHTDTLPGADTPHPQEQTPHQSRQPTGADTPPQQTPPRTDTPRTDPYRSRHHPPEQTPTTPLEQTPSRNRHPPRSTHPPPPEADCGIRSMSDRYASYWNAF